MKFKVFLFTIIGLMLVNIDFTQAAVKKVVKYRRPALAAYSVYNKKQPAEEMVTEADKAKIVYNEERVKDIVVESKNGIPTKIIIKKEKGVIEYVVTTDKAIVKVDAVTGKILNTISFQPAGKVVDPPEEVVKKVVPTKIVPVKVVKPVAVVKKIVAPVKKK